ncbi:unnamed protein product [Notodromas monacha]|uniref:Uncharacterized protein n=1 Tax=Notodromas monacha TaxID=399045 RepID=A0A7R9C466_9CRUS|nr:unnamed protein product [Notodromas monacha]CAG0925855.1 unnamed protein product [Notodromas monacha]
MNVVDAERNLGWIALPTPIDGLRAYSSGCGKLTDFGHITPSGYLIFAKYHCISMWRGIRMLPGYEKVVGRICSGQYPRWLDDGTVAVGVAPDNLHGHSGSFGPVSDCVGPLVPTGNIDLAKLRKFDFDECFLTDAATSNARSRSKIEVGDIVRIRNVKGTRIVVSRTPTGFWTVGFGGQLDLAKLRKFDFDECFLPDAATSNARSRSKIEVGDIVQIRNVKGTRIVVSQTPTGFWTVGFGGQLYVESSDVVLASETVCLRGDE